MRKLIGFQIAKGGHNIQGDADDPSGLASFEIMPPNLAINTIATLPGFELQPIFEGDIQEPVILPETVISGASDPGRLQVAVILEGGLCQSVVSDNPALVGLQYTVIDYDTEGAADDEVGEVLQSDGSYSEACIGGGMIDRALVRVVENEDYERAATAAGWKHGGDFDGFWYDGNEFESWKAAASADEAATYATAREVCDSEGLELFPEAKAA